MVAKSGDFVRVDQRMLKQSKPVSRNSKLRYYTEQQLDGQLIYIIHPDVSHVLGYLSVFPRPSFPLSQSYEVGLIAVHPEYQGQGIAKSLYGVVLSLFRYTLLSGMDQTAGGRRNWLSLSKIPGVEVRGYIPVNDKNFDTLTHEPESNLENRSFKDLLDSIMEMGGEYLGKGHSRLYGTTHYFAFDVVPGTGELESAVETKLKLYGIPKLVNPGLFARWTGQ
jgi:GNAT superfamily N-acetyltransferase